MLVMYEHQSYVAYPLRTPPQKIRTILCIFGGSGYVRMRIKEEISGRIRCRWKVLQRQDLEIAIELQKLGN